MKGFRDSITHDELRAKLTYHPNTGLFTWNMTGKGRRLDCLASASANAGHGYLVLGINQISYLQHRLAWFYTHASWPVQHIDHIGGDKTNNRIRNLRVVSNSVNSENMRHARAHSKYGILGVGFDERKDMWRARITARGKEKFLGYFITATKAQQAYLSAKRKLHEGCTI